MPAVVCFSYFHSKLNYRWLFVVSTASGRLKCRKLKPCRGTQKPYAPCTFPPKKLKLSSSDELPRVRASIPLKAEHPLFFAVVEVLRVHGTRVAELVR